MYYIETVISFLMAVFLYFSDLAGINVCLQDRRFAYRSLMFNKEME